MMRHRQFILFALVVAFVSCTTAVDAQSAFRTAENPDKKLPWYQPVPGEFPPANSAHYIQGELISVNAFERKLILRVDRNDSQQRGVWDLPLPLTLLPYGSIYHHGAPAALRDIPIGTHLHALCYVKDPADKTPPIAAFQGRISPESEFRQCIRLEDDFSFRARQKQIWQIDEVDLKERNLTATLHVNGKPIDQPKKFSLLASTQVLAGNGFGTLKSLQPGQRVQFNLTWVGLYGPGRIRRIWLDEPARNLAATHQIERHRLHIRERGLPGWVDAVDDKNRLVTITFFEGVDPKLFDELKGTNSEPLGWPTSGGAKNDLAPKGTLAVARECLMTYDPTNDRKGGNIVATRKVPTPLGSSGVQIQVQCGMLLEGFRPTKIVRFYSATWPFITIPKEEQFFGRE
ncbi:MAG: hypothetical protein ACKVHO_01545 [Verrucomicrobiia bacterium]|jgi:hypothetical protein